MNAGQQPNDVVTPMPTDTQAAIKAINECEALLEKATPGEWAQEHRKRGDGYQTDVFDTQGHTIATLAWRAVRVSPGHTTTDRADNAAAITATVNALRAHSATIKAALELAERVAGADVVVVREIGGSLIASSAPALHRAKVGDRLALVPITDDASSDGRACSSGGG